MDIINELSPQRFREIDDLLAFISIYDDDVRTAAYLRLLRQHRHAIQGRVCVEAGAGLGIFAAEMARLGARKVYAVEQNPLLAALARERLAAFPQIEIVHGVIEDFRPDEPVDVLVHEFFGQLLFDEDLTALAKLPFRPRLVLPDHGELLCGVLDATAYLDENITATMLPKLRGVLVSGLFAETESSLQFPILRWQFGEPFAPIHNIDIADRAGDLLAFGLQISHDGRTICRAGVCDNWALVWTPRSGDRFSIRFQPADYGQEVFFEWLE